MSRIAKNRFKRHIYLAAIGLVIIAVLTDAEAYEITQITFEPSYESQPAWSPDGSKIAFVSNRDGNKKIYVMDANGSDQQRLTYNSCDDIEPDWSPDGCVIAFTSGTDSGSEIYLMESDGSNQRVLTNSNDILDWPGLTYSTSADWSPDGNKIAFEVGAILGRNGSVRSDIYALDISNNTVRRVSYDSFNPYMVIPWINIAVSPSWSPDGDKIVYVVHKWEDGIKVKNVEAVDPNDLVGYLVVSGYPIWIGDVRWSPRGDRFAFSKANGEVYILSVDRQTGIATGEPIWLTYGRHPAWSPDGTKIAYHYKGDIWVMSGLPTLNADIQHDGIVNLRDFATLANYWLQDGSSVNIAGGYVVDLLDLAKLAEEWLKTEPWYQP